MTTNDDLTRIMGQLLTELTGSPVTIERTSSEERARLDAERRVRDEAALKRDAEERRSAAIRARLSASLPPKLLAVVTGGAVRATDAASGALRWLREGKARLLVLRGGVGTGKSTAAAIAMRTAIESGLDVSWHRPNDFVSAVLHAYAPDAPRLGGDLIVVDDVGRETKTDFEEAICTFVDEMDGRMILTTNLSREQFRERYGLRMIDRLNEIGCAVSVKGESMRKQKGDF